MYVKNVHNKTKGEFVTKEQFLKRLEKEQPDLYEKYDYSLVPDKVTVRIKVPIICKEHGIFNMRVNNHLYMGKKCPQCALDKSRLTAGKFIRKAMDMYGKEFSYSKAEYRDRLTPVTLVCNKCGYEFTRTPANHLAKYTPCLKCSRRISNGKRKITTTEFIKKAKEIHGDKYDYSYVNYVNNATKVKIYCNKHREIFEQLPVKHLAGDGCIKCGFGTRDMKQTKENKVMTKEKYLEKMKDRQPDFLDKYKYDRLPDSFTVGSKIEVGCPIHGYWSLKANDHLYQGNGCKQCRYEQGRPKKVYDTESFIREARKIHGMQYDYSKTRYVRAKDSVIVTCKEHGEFKITPDKHINGKRGCHLCGIIKCTDAKRSNTEEFVEKCKKIYHKFNYDYSRVNYVRARDKVEIICRKEGHGSFWATPDKLLNNEKLKEGKVYTKCPKCQGSSVERQITELLIRHKQLFTREYKIKGYNYRFDFYLPYYHHFHEHHGWFGHYNEVPTAELKWITEKEHKKTLQRDKEKRELIKRVGGTLTVTYNSDYEESQVEYKVIKMLRDCIKRKYHSDKRLQERYTLEKLYEESMVDDKSIKRLYGLVF